MVSRKDFVTIILGMQKLIGLNTNTGLVGYTAAMTSTRLYRRSGSKNRYN